jgi:hypothetical protein
MRNILLILFILVAGLNSFGQQNREGKVTYITSQHIYVKFNTTEDLSEGDTLYITQGGKEVPALQVKNLSSISCVCTPLLSKAFKVNENVHANIKTGSDSDELKEPVNSDPEPTTHIPETDSAQTLSSSADSTAGKKLQQDISGRLSLSSYTDLNSMVADRNQRMRYTFSMRANHLGNSKFSVESYLSFAHNKSNWEEVKENIFNGLKIYNLSLKYAFNETMYVSLGRKINPKLSSVGAIDGVQFEKRFNSITVGFIAGSRPDYADYSINPNLLQYGIYLGHEMKGFQGSMQNTLAFIEQTNHSMTDRRFAYFQHTNTLIKNLFFFGSAEVDLFKNTDGTPETVFDLTNTYLSLRYRIIHPLSLGLSFSARNNIIYYETYKDFLERLLDNETLQGWRFRVNYRPAKYLFMNIHAGYRYRKDDPQPSKNMNATFTYTQVPGIGASMTASVTWLETSYLNGMVYGLGLSRNIISDKLNGGVKYRYVDNLYRNSEFALVQHVGEANLSWMIYRKLSLSVYYEGSFENELTHHRIYLNISQRF